MDIASNIGILFYSLVYLSIFSCGTSSIVTLKTLVFDIIDDLTNLNTINFKKIHMFRQTQKQLEFEGVFQFICAPA